MLDSAQRQIEADRLAAEHSLRTEVGALATTLAGRIVEASVADSDVSRQVVDRFLDELEASTPANTEA